MAKFGKHRGLILIAALALLGLALAGYAARSPNLQLNAPVTLPADI